MTPEQRRYMHARQNVQEKLVNPVSELLEATSMLCAADRRRAEAAEALLEQMRPVWAQGYTSDSEAAQASSNALSELWGLLGVDNQTAAMEKLRGLLLS